MKALLTVITTIIYGLLITPVSATDYVLNRATITWDDGSIDDSLVGTFGVEGTMNIRDGIITQEVIYCESDTCEVVIDDVGSVTSLDPHGANVSIQSSDNSVGTLTLLSLNPNIITMSIYDDGTVETHEWEINHSIASRRNNLPENHTRKNLGSIGKAIASALRPHVGK